MCNNVGAVDRVVRALIGVGALLAAFLGLGVMQGSVAGIVAAGVGVIMLGTAALGFCPLYAPFKLSTCARKA